MRLLKIIWQMLWFTGISVVCYSLLLIIFYDTSNLISDVITHLAAPVISLHISGYYVHSKEYKAERFGTEKDAEFEISALDRNIINGRIFWPVIAGFIMTFLIK